MTPVVYYPEFIKDHTDWFDHLWEEIPWEQREDAPRMEYWTSQFGESYTYGQNRGTRTYESQEAHPLVDRARLLLKAELRIPFEGCFMNGYTGKRDWLGWHADNSPSIDHKRPIAILTFGQTREIQFREVIRPAGFKDKGEYGPVSGIQLTSGSLCLMEAGMQQTHEHRIPKAAFEAGPRISMTFRGLV